jgi:opacity protein-like surface antigen
MHKRLPKEKLMRVLTLVAIMAALPAPSFAQTSRGYVDAAGGFAVTTDTTSSDVVGEVGVRVAPNLFAFGNVGRFHNTQPSAFQPAVDATSLTLSTAGISVTGTAQVPAWYSMGGVRYIVPSRSKVSPYLFGGLGFAHLTDTAHFTYSSGTLPGSSPTVGDDVTSQLVSLGDFVEPPATNALMFALGGGVQAPVAPHLLVDVGYRLSRVTADTPCNAQSVTFGIGYRF